jgi:transposase
MSTITVGVDAHLDSLQLAAVANGGPTLAAMAVPNSHEGFGAAVGFATQAGTERWAIEGGGSYGRAFGRFLVDRGHQVVEVPTWRIDQLRRKGSGHKSDQRDAELAARVDHADSLSQIRRPASAEALRVLRNHRNSLVREQTASINRIRARLAEIDPQRGARLGRVRSERALSSLARVAYRGDVYRETLAMVIRDEAKTAKSRRRLIVFLERSLKELLPPGGVALKQVVGISTVGAATVLGEIGDIGRFPTVAAFAAWCGTAPLDASSGRHQRHRLNRRGNRQVNRVFHTAILTQLGCGGPAADYVAKRMAEGKTKNEAIRAACRHLAANVWRLLRNQPELT